MLSLGCRLSYKYHIFAQSNAHVTTFHFICLSGLFVTVLIRFHLTEIIARHLVAKKEPQAWTVVVCYTAVLRVVTQRSSLV